MTHGWLLRCDPEEGTCEVRLAGGGAMHEEAGTVVVSAGGPDPAALAAAYRRGDRPASPATPSAQAIWDAPARALHLVRDRTGLHPLFHARAADGMIVAGTDPWALLAEPGVDRALSAVTLAEWLLERPSPAEETLFSALRRVPAGHVLTARPEGQSQRRDWEPPPRGSLPPEAADDLGEVLEAAVARVVDRPAAVFLSGGIDSAAVATAARAVSDRRGLATPLALCADLEGSSELAMQTRVAEGLGLPLLLEPFRPAGEELARSLELAAAALWPVASAWVVVGDRLQRAAIDRGHVVLLDGNGGDELLDAGLTPARALLRRGRLGALADLARAEHAYTGARPHEVLRAAVSLGPRARPEPVPDWIRDAALRRELDERAASPPADDDLLDAFGAAGREAAFAAAQEGGYVHAHPFYDADVVALVSGLPGEALVRDGDPKSPARAYVRRGIPAISGRWPRPAVVGEMLDELLEAVRESSPGGEALAALGLEPPSALDSGQKWAILSAREWASTTDHRKRPGEGST